MSERDILFAWMLPYYADLRRTDAGVMSKNREAQWAEIAAKVNERTRNRHAVHLDDIANTGLGAEAAEALERIWARGFRP